MGFQVALGSHPIKVIAMRGRHFAQTLLVGHEQVGCGLIVNLWHVVTQRDNTRTC